MHQTLTLACLLGQVLSAASRPGYFTNFSTLPHNDTFSFGKHYAVLNLDLINDLVGTVSNTTEGQAFINCTSHWINAVHDQNPQPLTVYTRIYYQNSHYPDIKPGSSLAVYFQETSGVIVGPGSGNPNSTIQNSQLESSPLTQIWPAFKVNQGTDIVLQKTRYYAGFGNDLENILSAQGIDTVILVSLLLIKPEETTDHCTQSGIRTSGTVLATAYNLYSKNYNVYVISNTTIETPSPLGPQVAAGVDEAIKQGIIPILPANVITVEQAIAALQRSGPAVY